MDNRTIDERDSLDALLDRSRTTLAEPDELEIAVHAILGGISCQPGGSVTRLGRRRRVVAGVALSAVLVGAGMGAAAATGLWSPWADDPDLSYQFALPSGQSCEVRYGLMSTDQTTAAVDSSNLDPGLATWLDSTDVLALADVDGAMAAFQSGEVELVGVRLDDDGTLSSREVRPEEILDANELHAAAVEHAVAEVINAEVAARGLEGIAYGTESICGGVMQ